MIKIQSKPFSVERIISSIVKNNSKIGAICSFIGYVRDFHDSNNSKLKQLLIEHYDGMTEKKILDIVMLAKTKWLLEDIHIYHRIGYLKLSDPIVLIVVASEHRDEAFEACQFLIDFLKVKAPFWKKEISFGKSEWVSQKSSDVIKTF